MALRSGAGTGVIVSLVVFILTSVILLVFNIVFYAGQNKEKKEKEEAQAALKVYVNPQERNSDRFKKIEGAASQRSNVSVARYLTTQMEDVMQYVDGNPSTSLVTLKERFNRTVGEDGVVRDTINDLTRSLASRESELANANQGLQEMTDQLAEKDRRMAAMLKAKDEEMAEVMTSISALQDAAEDYRLRVDNLAQLHEQDREELQNEYEGQVADLESEIEQCSQDNVVLISRLDEFQSRYDADRIKPQNPATLVDGVVIDTIRSSKQVFINRGRRNHIVLGMTFEVYDDPSSIRVDPRTGRMPRGKASLSVIDIGESSSTCRITRSVPGRPVVRNDVIVNAVYDPDYQFKFLVHGKFDIDFDRKPTEAEAEYIRTLVVEWGGEVTLGDTLPGNLDFLVLGEEPPRPIDPPTDAPDHVINDWLRMNDAHEKYLELFRQAQDAQIPILSANRFFILIGLTQR